MNKTNFESLGIEDTFIRALNEVGYKHPTPIQEQAIPHLLEGKDLLGIAQTGTGKTAAFALPLLQRLYKEDFEPYTKCPRALILAPTRELALQIHEELESFGRHTDLRHSFIIGGVGQNPQKKALQVGIDVLVATPGRLLDLAGQGAVDLGEVEVLILDEADRLLDMGFIRDVKRIIALTPKSRQSLLFSATMPSEVANLSRELLKDPIRVDVSPKEMTVKVIDQRVVHVDNRDKQFVLEKLLKDEQVFRALVFTRTKHGANKVTKKLVKAGIVAEAIHGNKSQNARQKALSNFKSGETHILVATDIAARGIDVDGISHVINYELPHEPESYVHRIGRTARAGKEGQAWSLVDPTEKSRLRAIERLIKISPEEVEFDVPPRDPNEKREPPRRQPRRSSRQRNNRGRNSGGGNSTSRNAGSNNRAR